MIGRLFVCASLVAAVQIPQPDGGGVERGALPASWTTGASCPESPVFREHAYNDNFVILRQSACTNFEKPFLYLLFGANAALLVDTGAKSADVAAAVRSAMQAWSAKHGGKTLALIVVHSHGHGDHTAGDPQLKRRSGTTVIDATPEALSAFFKIRNWPRDVAQYSLGDRILDIVPIPGHQPASIAIYDRRTGILLTGDTLYPGRLYVADAPAFVESITRLVEFTATHDVAHVLGAHIENARTPFRDYPQGTAFQPEEHALELGRAQLLELQDALGRMGGQLQRRAYRDFTVWPVVR